MQTLLDQDAADVLAPLILDPVWMRVQLLVPGCWLTGEQVADHQSASA